MIVHVLVLFVLMFMNLIFRAQNHMSLWWLSLCFEFSRSNSTYFDVIFNYFEFRAILLKVDRFWRYFSVSEQFCCLSTRFVRKQWTERFCAKFFVGELFCCRSAVDTKRVLNGNNFHSHPKCRKRKEINSFSVIQKVMKRLKSRKIQCPKVRFSYFSWNSWYFVAK